jgi:hypothetical protein
VKKQSTEELDCLETKDTEVHYHQYPDDVILCGIALLDSRGYIENGDGGYCSRYIYIFLSW